ncbi:unnamed protein product [Amaranthus hypochondriacus]
MYADNGLFYSYFQNFSQEVHPLELEELCSYSQEPTSSLDSIITTSTISDYDLGGEGDLFKAPEPIIEEPIGSVVDPLQAAIAMMSCVDNIIPTSGLKVGDMESLQNEQLLCDVFDGCQHELLEKTSVGTAFSEAVDIKFPLMLTNELQTDETKPVPEFPISKSDSSGSLSAMEWTLVNGNRSLIHSPLQQPPLIGHCPSEERMQQLSRYRIKKSRRNFGRKIKYACRKALADSQPRIRGRFAKTEDADSCKKQ